jgi:dTDP-L-rhamnose 4-epimerase
MHTKVLITGSAGLVGSSLADELLENRYDVRLLDDLAPQLHGLVARQPGYLDREVEFIRGDTRDSDAVRRAIRGVDTVFILLNHQTVQPYENST